MPFRKTILGALVALAVPMSASADGFSLIAEPGVAIPLTTPQSQLYEPGAGVSIQALYGLNRFLDIGPSTSFVILPSETDATPGTAWTLGIGMRLKRPHDGKALMGISPWIDANLLGVHTGVLDRPGFDVAVGVSIPIGATRSFWVGPFVRYMHIIQPSRIGYDNHDAKILTVGLAFEFGSGPSKPVGCGDVNTREVPCRDRDLDGTLDPVDRCPDVFGSSDNGGCPTYQRLIVTKNTLELKEKLFFAWDEATLEEVSFPVLDEVVQALTDNPSFQVQIEGHTDSTGPEDHNQVLSEQRAQTVLGYLAAHGIAKTRLTSKGFASTVPADTNGTVEGREKNRRVEFVVFFNILGD